MIFILNTRYQNPYSKTIASDLRKGYRNVYSRDHYALEAWERMTNGGVVVNRERETAQDFWQWSFTVGRNITYWHVWDAVVNVAH